MSKETERNKLIPCTSSHNIVEFNITVEPPNKGHFGNGQFVLFSEAVPISEACHCLTI